MRGAAPLLAHCALSLVVSHAFTTVTMRFSNYGASVSQRRFSRLSAQGDTVLTETDATVEVEAEPAMLEAMAEAMGEGNFEVETETSPTNPYITFAQSYPFANNLLIATLKTTAADILAQTVISQTPLDEIDWQRSFVFCIFGCIYLGAFQYLYQVQIFKRLFDVDKFTTQTWSEKTRDGPGLRALAAQTALDLAVLTAVYLPLFYIFKAGVFSGSTHPDVWVDTGLENYMTNFAKDEADLIKVWLPADLVCFSVPLYLRLPVRHVVSFMWTIYLSFARGGH